MTQQTQVVQEIETVKALDLFRNILCFLLGFGFILTAAYHLTPMPDSYGLRDRFSYIKEHKDEFDTLFLGSSRIARGVVTSEIEEVFRNRGILWSTFNLGHPAMAAYEADFYLRKVLSWKPARLKWVFIELDKWLYTTEKFGEFTDRVVYWHSPAETRNMLESLWTHRLAWQDRWMMAASHLLQCSWKLSSFGQGPDITASLLGWTGVSDPYPSYLTEHGGYQPLENETDAEFPQRRAD